MKSLQKSATKSNLVFTIFTIFGVLFFISGCKKDHCNGRVYEKIFVANEESGTVSVIDAESGNVLNTVSMIDAKSLTVDKTIDAGKSPNGITAVECSCEE